MIEESIIGVIKGDTRSLDYGSSDGIHQNRSILRAEGRGPLNPTNPKHREP